MIYVGIDVAKDKHDCCILGSDGEILFSPFTFQNSLQGFDALYEKILSLTSDLSEIKVGLEAICYQPVTHKSLQKRSKP